MKLSLRTPRWQRAREAIVRARAATARVAAALWAWRWTRPLGRALVVATTLVVLAAIGRSTLGATGPAVPPSATGASALEDAGARDPPAFVAAAAVDDAGPPPPAPVEARHGPASPEDPVVLNAATQDDLQRLPGIGAKRAQAILQLRAKLGRFKQVDDLMKVRGIGRTTMKRLRPLVRLDPPASPDAGTG